MPLNRSAKTEAVLEKLRRRLQESVFRPGDRFLSTREVAANFEISYQTAHRLIGVLCEEGRLERRAGAGTFIPGGPSELRGVQLWFSSRARRPQSFGARLLGDLKKRLERDRIAWKMTWVDEVNSTVAQPHPKYFPVVWEAPDVLSSCLQRKRGALLLNNRPPPGLGASFFDSVSIDDFSGGVCAAQLLLKEAPPNARLSMLNGPEDDSRALSRRDGFLSLATHATVISAGSWFAEDALRHAATVIEQGEHGIFCSNDRLAQAVVAWCQAHKVLCPPLVGFDDAPIAEHLNLTTIAIPWEELIVGAVDILKRRLDGDRSAARQLIVTPRPIMRRL